MLPDAKAVDDKNTTVAEEVHLLRFRGGDGYRFRQRLLEGPELRICRQVMDKGQCQYVLPSQALIFVKCEQYAEVLAALDDHELHPFHVVITRDLEYLLEEVLQSIPSRSRPREKKDGRVSLGVGHMVSNDDAFSDDDSDHDLPLCVSRTFICVAPQLKESCTVAQSTTEAMNSEGAASHYGYFRGTNPRRFV